MREETCCCHMDYFPISSKGSFIQDSTYHGHCYTSGEALGGYYLNVCSKNADDDDSSSSSSSKILIIISWPY